MYFVTMDDAGIRLRAAESRADLPQPQDWAQISEAQVKDHANRLGLTAMAVGEDLVFTPADQSWPQLLAMLSPE